MRSAEALFEQLIEKTEDLLQAFHPSKKTTNFTEAVHLLDEREMIVLQLQGVLNQELEPGIYSPLYQSWQEKEEMLVHLVQSSLQELGKKLKEAQHIRSTFTQYDSYFRQMPYGAFVDKKR